MNKIKSPAIIIFCALMFSFAGKSSASSIRNHIPTDSAIRHLNDLKLGDFIKLSKKDYSSIIGRQMNLKEKISFKIMKLRMKHKLKKNSNLTVGEYLAAEKSSKWWLTVIIIVLLVLILIAMINPLPNMNVI